MRPCGDVCETAEGRLLRCLACGATAERALPARLVIGPEACRAIEDAERLLRNMKVLRFAPVVEAASSSLAGAVVIYDLTGQCRPYARDGDTYLLVASNGGADRNPAWLHNVRAHPDVVIQVGRQRQNGKASVIGPSDPGYERLWKIVNDNNHDRYTAYQEQTSRPIAVVALTPD